MVEWLLGQDPLAILVIALLFRSEYRTGQALRALRILDVLHEARPADSKETVRKEA